MTDHAYDLVTLREACDDEPFRWERVGGHSACSADTDNKDGSTDRTLEKVQDKNRGQHRSY